MTDDRYSIVVSSSGRQPDEWRERIATWVEARLRALWPDVPHICDPGPDPFSHAASFNLGVGWAETPIVVLMDADTLVDPGMMQRAVDHVDEHGGWVLAERYAYLSWYATHTILDGRDPDTLMNTWVRLCDVEWVGEKVSTAGFLVIRTADFIEHGGYDERLSGWAPDDVGFAVTYSTLFAEPTRLPDTTVYHLRHEQDFERSEHGWTDDKDKLMRRYLAANGDPEAVRAVRFDTTPTPRKGMRRL